MDFLFFFLGCSLGAQVLTLSSFGVGVGAKFQSVSGGCPANEMESKF